MEKRNEKMFDFTDSKLTHCCVIKWADITFLLLLLKSYNENKDSVFLFKLMKLIGRWWQMFSLNMYNDLCLGGKLKHI